LRVNPRARRVWNLLQKSACASIASRQEFRIMRIRCLIPIFSLVHFVGSGVTTAADAAALPKTVDLRPEFQRFGLTPRQQGARPTCSTFTVAGALEFAVAKRQGSSPRLSVEFLNWASNKTCGDAEDGAMLPASVASSGVTLLVNRADEKRARELIEEAELSAVELNPSIGNEQKTVAADRPLRQFSFVSFAVGILFGVFGYWVVQDYLKMRDRIVEYDTDGDRRMDEKQIWRKGHCVELQTDRDHDGVYDAWTYFQRGMAIRYLTDNNFDGKVDTWDYYSNGLQTLLQIDTDFNGIADETWFYTDGLLYRGEMRPNGSSNITLRSIYEHGIVREEFRDIDGDGFFDTSTKYNPFYVPISTNYIKVPYQPSQP